MPFVALENPSKWSGRHVLEVARPWPSAFPRRLFAGEGDGGALVARAEIQRKAPFRALFTLAADGALVLHRDVVRDLDAPSREGARMLPLASKKRGAPSEEWVLLPVDRYVPVDREASRLSIEGEDPFTGHVREVEELAFRDETALPPLFRLVENPSIVVARDDVAAKLAELTAGDVRASSRRLPRFPPDDIRVAPVDRSVDEARAAHRALFRLLARRGDAGDRALALTHPAFATSVALCIDRAPSDDTRRAACAHPIWAAFYALHVDRAARQDTREAAHRSVDGAVAYAKDVDLEADDALAARMLTLVGWWDAPTVQGFVEAVHETRRTFREAAATNTVRKVATRSLPDVQPRPRYREAATARVGPLPTELRDDVEAMTRAGYELLSLPVDASPSDVVDAVHAAIDDVQAGARALPRAKEARTRFRLGLACAYADALHRALGWQWGAVLPKGTAAVVSPDDAHAVVPLAPIDRLTARGAKGNTLALLFNMLVAGNLPPARDDELVFVS